MGSMLIFHYNHNKLTDAEMLSVMMPDRLSAEVRKDFFNTLFNNHAYKPAMAVASDDLNIAFDCGNGYGPENIACIRLSEDVHSSTSVGDIVVINGEKKMLVMPTGFEEI